ncbi:hypothetical protein BOO69_09700 [Sulfitobacter alexandrii]|uniref:Bacteriophage tail tape measure C-terminal domain-containing protein n=1 Tax=Sulfitobacter alexandrii TaxID=1917485 RepID=A0A1J0WH79_9RHOB|nr:phage tail tape measure C-terminal domain-containing protein [Sulfitobacter alexandrii]APE43658.1 hypothetical protein BOO69_09700 [Sulfitobacter alexandrii]
MSVLETSLILQGDARGLIMASQAGATALDRLDQKVDQTSRTTKSARASAEVFNREIDRQRAAVDQLRAGLDPVYSATQRLESGQETLTRAFRSGIITAREYDSALELLQAQHRQVAGAADLQAAATARLRTQTAGGAGGMQNFSYQLQDVFTQMGMGVPILVSLGQQAPQILSGFGTIGAMAGVAAAAILPLSAAIFGLGYQSKDTAEKVKTAGEMIEDALGAIGDAQATLRANSVSDLDGIVAKYGEVTQSVLTLMQAQNRLAMQEAMSRTRGGLNAVFEDPTFSDSAFRKMTDVVAQRNADVAELRRIAREAEESIALNIDVENATAVLETVRQQLSGEAFEIEFGIDETTYQNLAIFRNAIKAALAAENFEGALTVVTQMRLALEGTSDVFPGVEQGVVAVEDALRQALHTSEMTEDEIRDIEALLQDVGSIDVSSNLAAAADQASRIADELGRAVSNAIALANQGVGDVERARINYDFRDDPIGRAGALAGAEFDARASLPAGTDSTIRNAVEREKREFVGARVEAARYNQQLQEWRKQQSAAARSGRGGGRGGRRGRSDEERVIEGIRREMDRLAPSYARDVAALEEWREEALGALDPARAGYEAFAEDVEFIFGERLAEAYRKDLDNRDDWASGVERAFLDMNEDMVTFADAGENIAKKWSSGLEDAFVEMGRTGKFEVGSLVDYTLEQLQRLIFQQAILPGLEGGFDFLSDFIGGIFGKSAGATATQSHAGSTIGTGGVRRSYGRSAPLRADERLTVTKLGQRVFTPEQIANGATVVDALAMAAQNSGGGQPVVFSPQIKVENRSSTPVEGQMEEESDGKGGRSYRLVLADQVGAAISTKGGGARKALQNGYNIRQRGTRR